MPTDVIDVDEKAALRADKILALNQRHSDERRVRYSLTLSLIDISFM